jgi:hypothetical protein
MSHAFIPLPAHRGQITKNQYIGAEGAAAMQEQVHAEAEKRAGRVGVGWVHILFRAKNLSPRQEELFLRNKRGTNPFSRKSNFIMKKNDREKFWRHLF